jgi:hypothetical protein
MLSNETPPSTATLDAYQEALLQIKVKNLANALIRYEHNPDPREAPNPNRGVHIRRIVPACDLRPRVDEACAAHNAMVSGVGHPELFEHLWKGRS